MMIQYNVAVSLLEEALKVGMYMIDILMQYFMYSIYYAYMCQVIMYL